MIKGPYLNTEYLCFYLDSEIDEVKSQLLRQAINIGFDRNKMIKYLRNGIGIPANGSFIPKDLPGYKASTVLTYDTEKAKQLVNKFKNLSGSYPPKISLSTTSNYLSLCEFIQRELQKIGLERTPESSSSNFNQKINSTRLFVQDQRMWKVHSKILQC